MAFASVKCPLLLGNIAADKVTCITLFQCVDPFSQSNFEVVNLINVEAEVART